MTTGSGQVYGLLNVRAKSHAPFTVAASNFPSPLRTSERRGWTYLNRGETRWGRARLTHGAAESEAKFFAKSQVCFRKSHSYTTQGLHRRFTRRRPRNLTKFSWPGKVCFVLSRLSTGFERSALARWPFAIMWCCRERRNPMHRGRSGFPDRPLCHLTQL